MNAREDRPKLPRHHLPRLRVLLVAQQSSRDRLSLDALHKEARRAQRFIAHEVHLRDRNPVLVRRASEARTRSRATLVQLPCRGSIRSTSATVSVLPSPRSITASNDHVWRDAPPVS